MNRRRLLTATGALALAALAGCTEESPTEEPDNHTGTDGGNDTGSDGDGDGSQDAPPTGEPGGDDVLLAELASGNAAFGLDLLEYLASEEGGNLFYSPYSISVALAMTYAGADGETRQEMEETLHYTLGHETHEANVAMQEALESRETTTDPESDEDVDAFQLAVANSLWGREGYEFAEEFLQLMDTHYGAGLRRADFTGDPEGERERINEWVADATEDKIEDLLPDGSITPQTVLVLANAIYFMASWLFEFDPEKTENGTFTALDGSESTVPFMHQNLKTEYASVPGAEAIELPYVGEEVSMVVILPEEGQFESFERDLTAEQLFGIFEELSEGMGDLALPRFEYELDVTLKQALSDMGMPTAFTSGADFSGMVPGDDGGLWIDDVYHKAFVSVDEEGTEAAAATAVVMEESAAPEWGELRFDRPFLFCIRDRPTDAILFMGRVVDAGAAQGT